MPESRFHTLSHLLHPIHHKRNKASRKALHSLGMLYKRVYSPGRGVAPQILEAYAIGLFGLTLWQKTLAAQAHQENAVPARSGISGSDIRTPAAWVAMLADSVGAHDEEGWAVVCESIRASVGSEEGVVTYRW